MKKTQYRVLRIFDSWASRAQRAAVVYPILDVDGPLLSDAPARRVNESMRALRAIWMAKLTQLRDEGGFIWLHHKDNWLYSSQCAPFGMEIGRATSDMDVYFPNKYCNLQRICPFCWARRIGKSYNQVHYALYGTIDAKHELDPETGRRSQTAPLKCDVIEVERVKLFRLMEGWQAPQLFEYVRDTRRQLHRNRSRKQWGRIVLSIIEPGEPGLVWSEQVPYWRVTTRALLIVRRQSPNPLPISVDTANGESYTIRRTSYAKKGQVQITRQFLAGAVARLWTYPRYLLDPLCNPGMTLNLLLAMKDLNFKAFQHQGLFNNLGKRKADGRSDGLK
jgi:hypothetical protein